MVFIVFLAWKPFLGGSIVYFSHDDQQKIIRQGYLYPSVFLARAFQNKPSIYIDRFLANFFAITDLNNYFFGFHPREIAIENQNLQKFPFFSLPFFLIGLYYAARYKKILLISLLIVIINLALLKNFDKTDGILWLPLMYLIILGLFKFIKISKKYTVSFFVLTIIFSSIEYLHIIMNFLTNR